MIVFADSINCKKFLVKVFAALYYFMLLTSASERPVSSVIDLISILLDNIFFAISILSLFLHFASPIASPSARPFLSAHSIVSSACTTSFR